MAEQRYALQTILSIIAGILIVALTIAFVTGSVGPGNADELRERAKSIEDERDERTDRTEDQREERLDRSEDRPDRRDDRDDNSGPGSDD
ncbi:MAG TPA: hypothetical protein VNC78_00585 [Actinomycetota bacterium]|nr:hypothetical protein [Actinomycetota bacterium]